MWKILKCTLNMQIYAKNKNLRIEPLDRVKRIW